MNGHQNFTKHIYSNISIPQHIDNINIMVSIFFFIYNIIIINNQIPKVNFTKNSYNDNNNFQNLRKSNSQINKISNKYFNTIDTSNYKENKIFLKPKFVYENFVPKPDSEEIPTFTYENDKNINNFYNK